MSRLRSTGKSAASPTRLRICWRSALDDYVSALDWSPDGKRVSAASVSGPLLVFDGDGTVMRRSAGHGFGTTGLSWNPAGVLATCGQDGKVRLWDVKRDEEKELDAGAAWMEKVVFSPDGRYLAGAAGRGVRLWRPDGELVWEATGHGSTVADLAWRPGSSKELVAAAYGGLTFYGPGGPDPVRNFEWKGSTLKIAWSPDGRHIATGDQDATVHFWIRATGEDLQMWGYPTKVLQLSWNKSGRYLATGGSPAVTVWDCSGKGPAGTKPLSLEAHEDFVDALAFQRVGPLLASGGRDGTVAVWRVGRQGNLASLENLGSPVVGLAWSANDRRLAAGCEDGTVTVLEVP